MNDNNYSVAPTMHMDQRRRLADDFFDLIFDDDDFPWIVTDEATLNDIYFGDPAELSRKCEVRYGVCVTDDDFAMKLWQLLDRFEAHRVATDVQSQIRDT